MSSTVSWLNGRPQHITEICAKLREAVEEREHFFRFDPEKCAASDPLDLPHAPFNTSPANPALQAGSLWKFTSSLSNRLRALARFAFAPEKLGVFSSFNPAAGRAGFERSYLSLEECDTIFTSLQVDPADFRMRPPFQITDMKFFNACARLLNDYILYPQPTRFSGSPGAVFGKDFEMEYQDLQSGGSRSGTYLNDGIISIRSSAGSVRNLTGDTPAELIADDLRINETGLYFYYDPDRASGAEATPLYGEFQFQLNVEWIFNIDGVTQEREFDSRIYHLSPGSTAPLQIPALWQNRISQVRSGSTEYSRMAVRMYISANSFSIKLTPANYPELPYKYLN